MSVPLIVPLIVPLLPQKVEQREHEFDWKLYKQVPCKSFDKAFRKKTLSKLFHGHFSVYRTHKRVLAKCVFHKNCEMKIRLTKNEDATVDVEMINKCDDSQMTSRVNDKTKINCKMEKKIFDLVKFGIKPKIVIKSIQDDYPEMTSKMILSIIAKVRSNIRVESFDMFKWLDRRDFFNKYYVDSKTTYDSVKDDMQLITITSESSKLVPNRSYDAITYSSPHLIETNLRSMLKNDEIFLTIDGTFQVIQCGRKSKQGDKKWVSISLGTVSIEWNTSKKIWTHCFRPIMFMISQSESKDASLALFEAFYKISSFIGYDKADIKVSGFCSDMSRAFQNAAKETFPDANILSCWPHVSRLPYESYAPKRSTVAEDISTSLTLLRETRTEKEFKAFYDYVRGYLQKNYSKEYANKINVLCDDFNFRFVTTRAGFAAHTQCVERFNRGQNEMPCIKSDGKMFLSKNGGVFGILELAKDYSSDEIKYESDTNHYERDMLISANAISYDADVNILKLKSNEDEDLKNVHSRLLLKLKRENRNWKNEDEVIEYEYIESKNCPYSNKLIMISNKLYFNEPIEDYHVCRIIGFIQMYSSHQKSYENYCGIDNFVSKNKKRIIKDCFVFKIISSVSGDCFDADGLYCIEKKQITHSLINSPIPERILRRYHLSSNILTDLTNTQIQLLMKCYYNYSFKNSILEQNDDVYLVNRSSFRGIEMTNERISKSNNSLNGIVEVTEEADLNHLKSIISYHMVTHNKIKNTFQCDCCRFKSFVVCSHILSVCDVLNIIDLNVMLNENKCINTKSRDMNYYIGKTIRKYMLNPVTRTKGNFSGKIVKIVTNSENIDVFKVKFRTHDEFMSLDDLKYFV